MPGQRFKVGIVGLQPGRSWAARAHVPALRALSEIFEIVGVANTNRTSAEHAAAAFGLPRAFANVAELIAAPEIDIVMVTVKVPAHLEIEKAAIGAGKHVYCEWPLGRDLAEAEEMAALTRSKRVLGVVGTQAWLAPEIEYLKHLIADGFVGEVLSTTLVAWGGAWWGGAIPDTKIYAYLLDRTNGATMLTIPVGHTLAALRHVLGEVAEVSAVLATRRRTALGLDTGKTLPVSAPDQVLASGVFASGVPISIHYRGGTAPACSGRSMTPRVISAFRVLPAIRRWWSFPSRAPEARRGCSADWRSRPLAVPAGRKTSSQGMSPASMPGWSGICAMAPAAPPASTMRSRCIGSLLRSREQPKAAVARRRDRG